MTLLSDIFSFSKRWNFCPCNENTLFAIMFKGLQVELIIIKIHNHSLQNMIGITEYDLLRQNKKDINTKIWPLCWNSLFFSAHQVCRWTDKSKLAAGLIGIFFLYWLWTDICLNWLVLPPNLFSGSHYETSRYINSLAG